MATRVTDPDEIRKLVAIEVQEIGVVLTHFVEGAHAEAHRSSVRRRHAEAGGIDPSRKARRPDSARKASFLGHEPLFELFIPHRERERRVVIRALENEHRGTPHHGDAMRVMHVHRLHAESERDPDLDSISR